MKNNVKRFICWLFLVLIFVYYYITPLNNNPNSGGIPCTIKSITGYSCSGCGTQRALHQLLHFNFEKAFFLNVLFFLGLPFLLYLYFVLIEVYVTKSRKPTGFLFSTQTGIFVIIIVLLFSILRNIPYYPFILFKG